LSSRGARKGLVRIEDVGLRIECLYRMADDGWRMTDDGWRMTVTSCRMTVTGCWFLIISLFKIYKEHS
jgi:hypothetical protein